MTALSTRFHSAKNWSQRLPIAREIMAEVRAERETGGVCCEQVFPTPSEFEAHVAQCQAYEEKNDGIPTDGVS